MTSLFDDVTLTWGGTDYTVASDNVMRLIGKIEEHIRVQELYCDQGPPLAKLACAYGAALRHAGARVNDEEVYSTLYTEGASAIPAAVQGLLLIIVPPSARVAPKKTVKKAARKKKAS